MAVFIFLDRIISRAFFPQNHVALHKCRELLTENNLNYTSPAVRATTVLRSLGY